MPTRRARSREPKRWWPCAAPPNSLGAVSDDRINTGQDPPGFRSNLWERHVSHPMTRLLAMLELLQANHFLTGAALSARLGVDERTVRRYAGRLGDLGIPVVAERGRHGGYRLMPGYKLPPLMFTDEEATVMVLGLLAGRRL